MAIATERSGLEFYTRAARLTKDARGRTVFQKLAEEEREHLGTLREALPRAARQRSAARVAADVPVLQGRGERPVRRGREAAAQGRQRSAGAAHRHQVRARLAQVLQALRRAVRGLRGQADLPRVRRRGARAPRSADPRVPRAARAAAPQPRRAPAPAAPRAGRAPLIDLHTHTTASDGRCTPAELVSRAPRRPASRVLSVTDHDTVAGCERGRGGVRGRRHRVRRRHRDHRGRATTSTCTCSATFIDARSPALLAFLAEQRQQRIDRVRQMIARLAALGIRLDADAILQPALDDPSRCRPAGRGSRARSSPAGYVQIDQRGVRPLAVARPARRSCRARAPRPDEVIARIHDAGGIASLAHPGLLGRDEWIPRARRGRARRDRGVSHRPRPPATSTLSRARRAARPRRLRRLGLSRRRVARRRRQPGSVSLPRDAYERLVRPADARDRGVRRKPDSAPQMTSAARSCSASLRTACSRGRRATIRATASGAVTSS